MCLVCFLVVLVVCLFLVVSVVCLVLFIVFVSTCWLGLFGGGFRSL